MNHEAETHESRSPAGKVAEPSPTASGKQRRPAATADRQKAGTLRAKRRNRAAIHAQATERDADAYAAHGAADEDIDAANEPRPGGETTSSQAASRGRLAPTRGGRGTTAGARQPDAADVVASSEEALEEAPDVPEDEQDIIHEAAHFPDRDQEFRRRDDGSRRIGGVADKFVGGADEAEIRGMQDVDEGEWGRVSDPAYEREGSAKIQRAIAGDRSVEDHMTPAARAGQGGNDDPRGIEHLTRDQLYDRAKALNVPGRSKMSREELAIAVRDAFAH